MTTDLHTSLRRVMTSRGPQHQAAVHRLLFDLRQSLTGGRTNPSRPHAPVPLESPTMIFLSSPYNSPAPAPMVRKRRALDAARACAHLVDIGHTVYSPACHDVFVEDHLHDRDNWRARKRLPFIAASERLLVLTLPGWQQSEEVRADIQHARERGITVEFVEFTANGVRPVAVSSRALA